MGQQLATQLQLPFVDLDALIEEQTGESIAAIFSHKGEDAFRDLEAGVLRNYTETNERFVMACGGGTPCYHNNVGYINTQGTTVYLKQELPVIAKRLLAEKAKRPLMANLDDDEVLPYLQKLLTERQPYYLQAKVVVDESPVNVIPLY